MQYFNKCFSSSLYNHSVELTRAKLLQSSQLVTKQSLALSHRDFSPVSQYEGLQVSVEYVTRDGDMTPHVTRDGEMTSHVTRDVSQRREGCHHTHLQCYRSTRLGRGHNGDISRSVAD